MSGDAAAAALPGSLPNTKRTMLRRQDEVHVGGKQRQVVPDAKLRNQCVNRPHLNPGASAAVAQIGGTHMIVSIRRQHRQCGELLDKFLTGLWAREALQQFLQNEPSDNDGVASVECRAQGRNLRCREVGITAKRQRPDAGINQDGHRRERSIL